ncbi:hypothetical protein VIGAN_02193400 [Vigna angularis var. angularis]|uniref:BED-type domain-containing protein n=1 Tax=Vigna angularis var. angularis TaxID=157739 RepID=A0A0S3REY6_PHAAN|nr:hypothetical protein VIGAN_02193400 [Vigna angularis var. angularis]
MDHHKSNPLILVDDLASETLGPSESATINKKEISNVWNFFTKIGKDEDGIEKAACKYCGVELGRETPRHVEGWVLLSTENLAEILSSGTVSLKSLHVPSNLSISLDSQIRALYALFSALKINIPLHLPNARPENRIKMVGTEYTLRRNRIHRCIDEAKSDTHVGEPNTQSWNRISQHSIFLVQEEPNTHLL